MTDDPLLTTLKSADGLKLAVTAWKPEGHPKAALVLVHGIGEYSGRYHHVAEFYVQRGYAVFALDLRGHGKSQGKRGHVNRFAAYLDDVHALVDYAHEDTPEIPLFLIGHSMGGLVSLAFALKRPDDISAVIVSSPGLRSIVEAPGWKVFLGNVLSNIAPSFSMENEIDPNTICQDPEIVEIAQNDPLVHSRISARWYTEFVSTAEWVMEEAHAMSVPSLILQAGDDKIVDPSAAEEFFNRIGLDDKHFIEYPGYYHEIFNEPGRNSVFSDIESWITPRLQHNILPE